MSWLAEAIDKLQSAPTCGYGLGRGPSTEPTAFAALALLAYDRLASARGALEWLRTRQTAEGCLGIDEHQSSPCWPTSLAILAWQVADQLLGQPEYAQEIASAVTWLLSQMGTALEQSPDFGHDTTLVGWPWVSGTHSWIEPTSFSILSLKKVGHAEHHRVRGAVHLLVDRLLPQGGCNYGNTIVLGNILRPHVQPTGICLLALAGEPNVDERIDKSLEWVATMAPLSPAATSLSFAIMALAAHGLPLAHAGELLAGAYKRTSSRADDNYKYSLLALAALGERSPMLAMPSKGTQEWKTTH